MGISTHVLDTASGRPGAGIAVSLERLHGSTWALLNEAMTDQDGRCKHLLPEGERVDAGSYRVRFGTAGYFAGQGLRGLYPYVDIVFEVSAAGGHYHIPLLLAANGYTTYRGS